MANKELKKNKEKKNSLKSMKAELKKVIWPTPKQLANNTLAVVAIVVVISAIVFVLDFAFESANKYGVDKIKQVVVDSNNEETENTEATETTDESAEVVEENSEESGDVVETTTETEASAEENVENNTEAE